MKNSFFLIIPPQQKNAEHAKIFQEQALKHWIEELPTANPSLATRLFHDFIVDFNQLVIDPTLRLEALEMLRPSYLIIEDYLRSRLMQSNFPKTESDLKIMDILVAIEKEFALGYWVVVRDLTRRSTSWFKGKNIALSIQRCIKGLSAVVVTYCSLYRPIPDWVWIDLHSLYKLGESSNKHDTKVASEFNDTIKTTTIEDSYRQILLFSVVQPSRLMQKEIPQVYQLLEQFSPYLRLDTNVVANEGRVCVLRMDDDKPPVFQENIGNISEPSLRYLNFERLFKAFAQKEKYTDPGIARFSTLGAQPGNHAKLPIDLLEYIEQRFKAAELPKKMLFSDRLDRFVALGLESAFDLQNSGVTPVEKNLELLVQSASETSLACDFPNPGVLSIGSLVSLRKMESPEFKRSLGIVSKLVTFKQDNKLHVEVDFLTDQFYAVSFEYLDGQTESLRKKALLYGVKIAGKEEKSFIIMESFMLKDGDIVRMFIMNEDYPIILKDRTNIGLGYWQFECRRMAETQMTNDKKQGYDFI